MQPLPRHLLLILAGLLCGVGVAHLSGRSTTNSVDKTTLAGAPSRPGASPAAAAGPGDPSHTLTALHRITASLLTPEQIAGINRMSTADLQALLTRLDSILPGFQGQSAASTAMFEAVQKVAVAALYSRDPAAAMTWMESLPRSYSTNALTGTLIQEASRHDPQLAATWLVRCDTTIQPEFFGTQVGTLTANAPLSGAAATLAMEEALSARPIWAEHGRSPDLGRTWGGKATGYADDFDFKTYVEHSRQPSAVGDAVTYWAAKDPDAAWAGLRDALPGKPALLNSMIAGIASLQGDTAAARWAAARLGEEPAEARAGLIAALADGSASASLSYDGYVTSDIAALANDQRLRALMTALPREEDRVTLAAQSFSPQPDGTASTAALKILPTPELQIQALSASAENLAPGANPNNGNNSVIWTGFQAAMEELHLPAEAQAAVHNILIPPKP